MKLVIDDHRLGRRLPGRAGEGIRHVDGHRRDLLPLVFRQGLPKPQGTRRVSALDDIEHPATGQICHQRNVVLAPAKALLVQSDLVHPVGLTPQQPPLDRPMHDLLDRMPVYPQKLGRLGQRPAGLDHVHRKGLEEDGEASTRLGPGSRRRHHAMLRALAARHPRPDDGGELHDVQMPPLAFGRVIVPRARPPALRAGNLAGPIMLDGDLHFFLLQLQVGPDHLPRRLDSQQQSIVCSDRRFCGARFVCQMSHRPSLAVPRAGSTRHSSFPSNPSPPSTQPSDAVSPEANRAPGAFPLRPTKIRE